MMRGKRTNQAGSAIIIAIVAAVVVAIVIVVLIATGGNNDTQPVTPTQPGEQIEQSGSEAEATSLLVPNPPDSNPGPDAIDIYHDYGQEEWGRMTDQEKIDWNPSFCNHITQWISAVDGSCIPRTEIRPEIDQAATHLRDAETATSCQEWESSMFAAYDLMETSRDLEDPAWQRLNLVFASANPSARLGNCNAF